MNILVRPITPNDYQEIIEVIKRSNRLTNGDDYIKDLIDAFEVKYTLDNFARKAQEITYFVAVDNDNSQLAGIIGIKDNALRTYYVDSLYQGHGVGRKLFDAFEKEATQRGLTEVIVESSIMAQPIYQHFGFEKVKMVEKEINGMKYSNTLMRKKL